ncbi:MAG TPA: S41 family peptidase [Anaeromyxobacter sp.]|nr:S41 family peptidase [Anaeromyxobacter sp.]
MITTSLRAVLLAASLTGVSARAADDARLLRFPDVNGDRIAFSHGGDLWTVSTSGGPARRLTSGDGLELFPRFSPDGKWIAFTGQYDGTFDVYVMPASGGAPRRLTFYPSMDTTDRMGPDNMVLGWTPDGRILFRSMRDPRNDPFVGEPWAVSPEGGPVERYPIAEAGHVSFSPDGKRAAITRTFRDFRQWKRYQGGLAEEIWIYDLATHEVERVSDWPGTNTQPMWIGEAIYYLSDREDWKTNLWRYDLATRTHTRVTSFQEFDCKWAHAGSGKIVFENGGWIYLLDPGEGVPRKIAVQLSDDERRARRRWVKVDDLVTTARLGPDGKRAVFTARGEVFTVPAENGDIRNLTRTSGVREKDAVWSPDGRWIAYFSDATGEEELYVLAQDGRSAPVRLTDGPPTFHFAPVWSPDSTRLAWADRGLRLWWVSLTDKKPVQVVKAPFREIDSYAFSPDSRWLAYATETASGTQAMFLHDTRTRTTAQVTADGFNVTEPVFDPGGRYLYLLSDRDVAPTLGRLALSFTVDRMTRPHAIVLRADLPSPFAPRSDEVRVGEAPAGSAEATAPEKTRVEPVRIDLSGIEQRIVPFPVSPANDEGLRVGKGKVYWRSVPPTELRDEEEEKVKGSVMVFDLEKRKESEVIAGVEEFDLSADGARLLYRSDKTFGIVEPKEGVKPGDGALKLDGLKMELDPHAEWAEIYAETWRLFRDFFYLSDMGRVDWPGMRRRYAPLLASVTDRYDLTYVLGELVGELGTSHTYVGGGDRPKVEKVPVGTLGADLVLDRGAGRWRIGRILEGQSWVEGRTSPLAVPGVEVAAGDYLLAIDGQELLGSDEPYRLLAGTAGRMVRLTVNARPVLTGAREVSVRPLGDDRELRYFNWVESNRRAVDRASGGRLGYLHLPDMGRKGLTEFIRQFYPQANKDGLVIDDRGNGGGFVSQLILERLRRKVMGMENWREERPATYPDTAVSGPMVMLLDQYSASDGDAFPNYFRAYGLGQLIGKRTWGGLVGIRGDDLFNVVDGGYAWVPEFGDYDLERRWIVENEGVSPDIEVDYLPIDRMAGRDPQLERAVAELKKRVAAEKPVRPAPPPSKDLRNPTPLKPRAPAVPLATGPGA